MTSSKRRERILRRFRIDVAVASVEDLVAMKRALGREKDAAHLTVLLEFMRGTEPGDDY